MGIWNTDSRVDIYEIDAEPVKNNAAGSAAILNAADLSDAEDGTAILAVSHFGETYSLCKNERFYHQPIAAGSVCSGFLVKEDVLVTAGHYCTEKNVKDLRIVFGFKMLDASNAVTRFSNKSIYKGVEIIGRVYNPMGNLEDWALVQLDRKVTGQPIIKISEQTVTCNHLIYAIGHPLGLPMKVAFGTVVRDPVDPYFVAELDIYSGSSGSPVFCQHTHEVLGVVARGDERDFRWTGKCWASVVYPNPVKNSEGAHCTLISKFKNFI